MSFTTSTEARIRPTQIMSNGVALCKIHHAAFDRDILGIRPDLVIQIRADVLREQDGPMLLHGLQELHGLPMAVLPKAMSDRPDQYRLEERYEQFCKAG